MNEFAIGIPTLNRIDLLAPALKMYLGRDFINTKIYIVDNGRQVTVLKNLNTNTSASASFFIHSPNLIVLKQETNIGVAASWNLLCKAIFEHNSNALILNDDIFLNKNQTQVTEFIKSHKNDFYTSLMDWCAFILPRKTFETVGKFDEQFYPAYYEDNDYAYRMKLVKLSIKRTDFLNPMVYFKGSTATKQPEILLETQKLRALYVAKWGGAPGKEKFSKPFNGKK